MVDFRIVRKEPKRNDPLFSGELIAWVNKEGAPAADATQRTCKWEIIPYASMHGEWIIFRITEGGVTGYESFTLKDEKTIQDHTIDGIFGERKYWSACAGGMGWDAMRIPIEPIRAAVTQWLETQKE